MKSREFEFSNWEEKEGNKERDARAASAEAAARRSAAKRGKAGQTVIVIVIF